MPLNLFNRQPSLSVGRQPGFNAPPMATPQVPMSGSGGAQQFRGGFGDIGAALAQLGGGGAAGGALSKDPRLAAQGVKEGQTPDYLKGTLGAKGRGLAEFMLGPEAIAGNTQKLFQLLSASPAFAQMLRGIGQTGQKRNTAIQSGLARSGMSGSGVGALTGALGSSATSNAIGQARGNLFSDALNTAIQSLLAQSEFALGAGGHFAGRTGEGFKPGKFIERGAQSYLQGAGQRGGF